MNSAEPEFVGDAKFENFTAVTLKYTYPTIASLKSSQSFKCIVGYRKDRKSEKRKKSRKKETNRR